MSDPIGGLLEGLLEGAGTGYTFRENVKAKRRRQRLDEELLTLRQLESRRAEAASQREEARAGREGVQFEQEQQAFNRAQGLRREVGEYLQAPTGFRTPGQFISGKPPTRLGKPLSTEATVAQQIGEVMGRNVGVDPTDEEALLYGTGMAPAPQFHQRAFTQADYLERIREAAKYRRGAGTTGPRPMTREQASRVVAKLDADYSTFDADGNITKHYLTPRHREALIAKMMAGTITEDDIPDLPSSQGGPMVAPPIRVAPPPGRGGRPAAPAPGGTSAVPQRPAAAPGDDDRQARLEEARALITQYRDVPIEDLEAALAEDGFDEEEIADILGTPGP